MVVTSTPRLSRPAVVVVIERPSADSTAREVAAGRPSTLVITS